MVAAACDVRGAGARSKNLHRYRAGSDRQDSSIGVSFQGALIECCREIDSEAFCGGDVGPAPTGGFERAERSSTLRGDDSPKTASRLTVWRLCILTKVTLPLELVVTGESPFSRYRC